jgi:hypothetical protein
MGRRLSPFLGASFAEIRAAFPGSKSNTKSIQIVLSQA